MPLLVSFIIDWCRVKIIDNGDGTWAAVANREIFINVNYDEALFTIIKVNATYLNDTTYVIGDTCDARDVPQIKITDNGDGRWSAITDHDNLIILNANGYEFEIRNANAEYITSSLYQIEDTNEEN